MCGIHYFNKIQHSKKNNYNKSIFKFYNLTVALPYRKGNS